ncbi:hypothetical protein LHP98_12910 [Rhodobacter sp. Har01]|uniref:hypothetical protein n=1 Tax=Rhodobacter sp. Har01 TaxID=2883999 RepID=UPI001D076CD8|nr:hypothetical protein [Rhodobacter sp. Har01]MCB6179025.1 hypothetical protein [Rhodobacter sp. Har01]
MTKPPMDTKGPIVKTGPTRGENRSRNKDGRWRAKRSDAGELRAGDIGEMKKPPNLARWFWGGIILMAVLTILLSFIAIFRQSSDLHEPVGSGSAENSSQEGEPAEKSASELEEQLNKANKAALEAVKKKVEPLIDAAYEPVYDAIPIYADFHYSVLGEYTELTTAVLPYLGSKLQEMLFSGLEERLDQVSVELDIVFNATFQSELESGAFEIDLGPLTKKAKDDALKRMRITVPVSSAATLGTAAAIKVATTAMAKKIASKLAIKAAAKAGGKLLATSTGAGAGATLCLWSGPGAGLCAAAGGVAAWFIADSAIVKLDEFWTRDDFQAYLSKMLDEQKVDLRSKFEKAFAARAVAVQKDSDEIVRQHDFTLRELSGVGNAEICRFAENLKARYEPMREHLRERRPGALQALSSATAEFAENLSLRTMIQELDQNLQKASSFVVTGVQIQGNLPEDYRADRDVSGRLTLDGKLHKISRVPASENDGFSMSLDVGATFPLDQPLNYSLVLEQHLRIMGNRFFGGVGKVEILDAIGTLDGLNHSVRLSILISHDEATGSVEEVGVQPEIGQKITLILHLRAVPLAALEGVPDCQ